MSEQYELQMVVDMAANHHTAEFAEKAAAELAALRAQVSAQAQRIETLEKALEPLAELEPHIVDGTNGPMLTQVPSRHSIAIAIRRAAAALEPPKA